MVFEVAWIQYFSTFFAYLMPINITKLVIELFSNVYANYAEAKENFT